MGGRDEIQAYQDWISSGLLGTAELHKIKCISLITFWRLDGLSCVLSMIFMAT